MEPMEEIYIKFSKIPIILGLLMLGIGLIDFKGVSSVLILFSFFSLCMGLWGIILIYRARGRNMILKKLTIFTILAASPAIFFIIKNIYLN